MLDDKRLQQITEYAEALAIAAEFGRGNIGDTRDIVYALEELIARREIRPESRDA